MLKLAKNGKKLVKNWYYVHFDTKKICKNYELRIFQNNENKISYYQFEQIGKNRDTPKLGRNW